eukprot:COSAG05_NODE_2072_length_3611_cov_1320.098804_1_plen_173_part_00
MGRQPGGGGGGTPAAVRLFGLTIIAYAVMTAAAPVAGSLLRPARSISRPSRPFLAPSRENWLSRPRPLPRPGRSLTLKTDEAGSASPSHELCSCNAFCTEACAWNTSARANITLYRRTPHDDLRLADHDTGSAKGDAEFSLYSFSWAQVRFLLRVYSRMWLVRRSHDARTRI